MEGFLNHTATCLHDDREHGVLDGVEGAEALENSPNVDTRTLANAVIFGSTGIIVQHDLSHDSLSYTPMGQASGALATSGVGRTQEPRDIAAALPSPAA